MAESQGRDDDMLSIRCSEQALTRLSLIFIDRQMMRWLSKLPGIAGFTALFLLFRDIPFLDWLRSGWPRDVTMGALLALTTLGAWWGGIWSIRHRRHWPDAVFGAVLNLAWGVIGGVLFLLYLDGD